MPQTDPDYWVETRHLRESNTTLSPSHRCVRCGETFGDIVELSLYCVFTDKRWRTHQESGKARTRGTEARFSYWLNKPIVKPEWYRGLYNKDAP